MNILITGCKGQLGTEIGKIAATDSMHTWHFTDIDTLDICNTEAVEHYFTQHAIEVCVNCAAYTAVDKAEDEPELAYKVNALAPQILAQACLHHKALLVHVSTDYVFEGNNSSPYTEDEPVRPQSVYGSTKAEGERLIRESGCKHFIIRTAWLYSAFGKNFVKTMLDLGESKDEISVVCDQKGTPTWAYDLAEMIVSLVNKTSAKEVRETFHFTNEGITTWHDFSVAIMELAGKKCKVIPVTSEQYPTKAHRPAYSVLDKTKIKRYSGREIPFWRDSLIKCLIELNQIQ